MTKEQWKVIPNYPLYEVSNLGRVKSNVNRFTKRGSFIMGVSDKTYQTVLLSTPKRSKKLVHRLVAELWIPNPSNKPFVNHIDNDPTNNAVANLEWCTPSENLQHAQNQGRLTEAQRKGGIASATKAQARAKAKATALVGITVGSWYVNKYIGLTKTGKVMRETLSCTCKCGVTETIHMVRLTSGVTMCRQCAKNMAAQKRYEQLLNDYPAGYVIGTWKLLGLPTKRLPTSTVRRLKFTATCIKCGNRTILTQPSVIGTKPIKKCEHCIKEMKI